LNRGSVCEEGCCPAQAGVYTVLMSRTFFFFGLIFARSSSFALTISTMASSDDWIKSFDSMTIIPSPSLSQSQSSPGGSPLSGGTISGEYGGGGAKRATLFYYVDSLAPLCLGFVGLGRKRFCLKPKADGAPSCGVAKHSIKFSPSSGSYYLRGVDSTAFCEPSLAQVLVPEEYRGQIGLLAKTMSEWKDVFRSYLEQATDVTNIQVVMDRSLLC